VSDFAALPVLNLGEKAFPMARARTSGSCCLLPASYLPGVGQRTKFPSPKAVWGAVCGGGRSTCYVLPPAIAPPDCIFLLPIGGQFCQLHMQTITAK